MPNINTLVEDIYKVVDGKGGWNYTVSEYFKDNISEVLASRFSDKERPKGTLRMSNLGSPCHRKLWYSVNTPDDAETLRPATKFKFLYGDILETLLLSLAKAAGHDVQGEQDTLSIQGIVGHRDCVIDGITVDVKSASSRSFQKFQSGSLRNDDPFGYISQLSSYVYAGRNSKVKSHPTIGAFLVVDKTTGEICLDAYEFKEELNNKENEVEELKTMVGLPKPPPRAFDDVEDGKSGNRKLGTNCGYCDFKSRCWPDLRTFIYSNGPRFLTKVVRQPDVPEAN